MQRSLRAHDTPRLHARSAGCCLSRELGAATTLTSWFWVQEKTLLPTLEMLPRFREMWYRYFTEFRGRIVPLDLLYSHVDEAKVSLVLSIRSCVSPRESPTHQSRVIREENARSRHGPSITGGVEGLMQKSSSNTIMGRVKAGAAAGRCRRTGPKPCEFMIRDQVDRLLSSFSFFVPGKLPGGPAAWGMKGIRGRRERQAIPHRRGC